MKRILMVEDDRLLSDVYGERLRAAGFAVDVAADGTAGLEAISHDKPDLVLLDLMLPHTSGVDVLRAIRSRFDPRDLPVLVLTNAFIGGMVQEAWAAGASQVIIKATMTPKLAVQLVRNALDVSPRPATATRDEDAGTQDAPAALRALWEPLKMLVTHPKDVNQIHEMSTKIRALTSHGEKAGLLRVADMSRAIEMLLRDLLAKPRHVAPSVLLTLAQAFDALKFLFEHAGTPAGQRSEDGRVIVVDDDEFTCEAVKRALKNVHLHVTAVHTGSAALQRLTGTHFDAVLLDIELPDADGFALCSQLRARPHYQRTPILFLTGHASFEQRTESVLRGGDDFIPKPFLFSELAVKVLSFVVRGPLKPDATASSTASPSPATATFSRRDLNALKQALLGSMDRIVAQSTAHRN